MAMVSAKADTAAGRARHMSRLLRAAGMLMSDRVRSEGYIVHRIGFSSSVGVNYHFTIRASKEQRAEKVAAAREVLRKHGYEIDERGWWEAGR